MCIGICCRIREGIPKIHPLECQVCVLGCPLKKFQRGAWAECGLSYDWQQVMDAGSRWALPSLTQSSHHPRLLLRCHMCSCMKIHSDTCAAACLSLPQQCLPSRTSVLSQRRQGKECLSSAGLVCIVSGVLVNASLLKLTLTRFYLIIRLLRVFFCLTLWRD